jgi:beta-phosphoglucomutase
LKIKKSRNKTYHNLPMIFSAIRHNRSLIPSFPERPMTSTPLDRTPNPDSRPLRADLLETLQAVIFDMDGVLCDTMPYHLKAWELFVQQTPALAGITQAALTKMGGKRNHELLPEVLGRPVSDAEVQRWGGGKEALYRELITGQITWLPGLLAFLNAARAAGLKIGLGTSACQENADLLMSQDNIGDFFPVRVTEKDVIHGKPDPQCYLLVAERLGIDPRHCLVFEDASAGVQAARRAGMHCWGLLTTEPEANLLTAGADLCMQDFNDPRLTALLTVAYRQV